MSTRAKVTTLALGLAALCIWVGSPLSAGLCLVAAYFAFKNL